jgi:hypothetical protein
MHVRSACRACPVYLKSATVPPGSLTALDVWVDSHDVVRQMTIHLRGSDGQTTLTVTFTDSGQPQRSVQISLKNFEDERLREAEMSARLAIMFV